MIRSLALLLLAASVAALAGCDIASEVVPANALIRAPRGHATLYVGQPFPFRADIESDGPLDSIVVRLVPYGPGASDHPPARFRVDVPPALRSGTGILEGRIDTTLRLDRLPMEGIEAHIVRLDLYLTDGRIGAEWGSPHVRFLSAPAGD